MKLKTYSILSIAFVLAPLAVSATGLQVMIGGKEVTFADVPQSAWFSTYVQTSAQAGIVSGYKDANGNFLGQFGPSDNVTIAQALKIAVLDAGYNADSFKAHCADVQWRDYCGHWAASYVGTAKAFDFQIPDIGVDIDRPATRAEVAAIFADAFQVSADQSDHAFSDVQGSTQYAGQINALNRDGVVSGDVDASGKLAGTFRPDANINRAEATKIAVVARQKYGTPGVGRQASAPASSASNEAATVTYTGDAFVPGNLDVKPGTTVQFLNGSNTSMIIDSNPHPTHTDLPALNAPSIIKPGETYSFTFVKVGTWGYHNHLNPSIEGVVTVK